MVLGRKKRQSGELKILVERGLQWCEISQLTSFQNPEDMTLFEEGLLQEIIKAVATRGVKSPGMGMGYANPDAQN